MGCHMEHSDATQTAPSITDTTYSVMRELRESQHLKAIVHLVTGVLLFAKWLAMTGLEPAHYAIYFTISDALLYPLSYMAGSIMLYKETTRVRMLQHALETF